MTRAFDGVRYESFVLTCATYNIPFKESVDQHQT